MRLLLDVGGVVIKTPFELLDAVGSPPWFGPFDPEADALWRQMQAGAITERQYWDRRSAELFDGPDPVTSLMRAVFDRPEREVVRPEIVDLLEHVERPAALTNDLARFHDADWIARVPIVGRFEPLIDLSFEGVLKPAPEAFALACERLESEPGDVLFVDDQPTNVAGAAAVGMRTVWFDVTDPGRSADEIREAMT